jgi:DNA-binding Xre family transcriptional regulator|nr:MAG TPA: hypothetical protein [Caudoviricetes sp.]
MRIDRKKYEFMLAKTCKSRNDLIAAGLKPTTLSFIGKVDTRPATVGKIAKAIGCDITDLLADEEL